MTSETNAEHRPAVSTSNGEWLWDSRYAEHEWPSEPDRDLVELAGQLKPGTVLDLGCGPCRNSIWLAERGWEVTGVDASAVGLAQARERAKRAGVVIHTVEEDLMSYLEKNNLFDLVVIANIHLVDPERSQLFLAAAGALHPGGHLFVIGHHLSDLGRTGPPDPERLYTVERIQDAFPTLLVHRLGTSQRPAGPGEPPLTDVVVWAEKPQ